MALADSIHVLAEVEGQPSHIESVLASERFELARFDEAAQHALNEVVRELIVTRLDRRMGREIA